jgi:hypothetical protein
MNGAQRPEATLGWAHVRVADAMASLLDAAIGAWLWGTLTVLLGHDVPVFWGALISSLLTITASLSGNRLVSRDIGYGIPRAAFIGLGLAIAAVIAGPILGITPLQGAWWASAFSVLSWIATRAIRIADPTLGPSETLRWLCVGAAGTYAMSPFYYAGALGSGDAHWYTIMIGDFVTQLRDGQFPIWVGQSHYAFNGAVSPLRYAPGILYASGIMDLLTARALPMMALRNAVLVSIAVLGAFSAYFCMRPILRERPTFACALAVLWVLSPGVLAPPMIGDLFMTFCTLPFIPIVLHGCWRLWRWDDLASRVFIGVGLAGTWLCHSPVALWFTMFAGGCIAVGLLRPPRSRQLLLAGVTSCFFVVLGSIPFASVLTLDNQVTSEAQNGTVVETMQASFPGNFFPIGVSLPGLQTYQLGYALLAVGIFSLAAMLWRRPPGSFSFAIGNIVVAALVIPIPGVCSFLWLHVPNWFVIVQNVWPVQRLFLVWTALAAFLGASVLAGLTSARKGASVLAYGILSLGVAWSFFEVGKLHRGILPRRNPLSVVKLLDAPQNLVLTRYSYTSFAAIPSYFSHAHMEPDLENRLLDIDTQQIQIANADAAAPAPDEASRFPSSRLVAQGTWILRDSDRAGLYSIDSGLDIEAGKHYAIRVEFADPNIHATMELSGNGLWREFILPDSGVGAGDRSTPMGFGSLASCSHVFSLSTASESVRPILIVISNNLSANRKVFARYWCYEYDSRSLPVAVESWVPYRARVTTERACYLETPRLWLNGWRARVNGVPAKTIRSKENLVMVPVGAGQSTVTLEYVPPLMLTLAFWSSLAGWCCLSVAFIASVGLAPETPPSAVLEQGLERTFGPLRSGWGALARALRRRPAVGLIALVLVAMISSTLSVSQRRKKNEAAQISGAGPLQISFRRPHGDIGLTEPILSTGHASEGTVISARFTDSTHGQLLVDIWGKLYASEPILMDEGRIHRLVISHSGLYPKGDRSLGILSPNELQQLRAAVAVEMDGVTVLNLDRYAYESTVSEIQVGRAPFGALVGEVYPDYIGGAIRLPLPRRLAVPPDAETDLTVAFPVDRLGKTEALEIATSRRNVVALEVTYLDAARVRLSASSANRGLISASDVALGSATEHTIRTRYLIDDSGEPTLECSFDGKSVLAPKGQPGIVPVVVETGAWPKATGYTRNVFSGKKLTLTVRSPTAVSGGGSLNAQHFVLRLPTDQTGKREPLLSTGKTGAADIIYFIYESSSTVRVGFDHWGVGGSVGAPVDLDYSQPHDIWITSTALGARANGPSGSDAISVFIDGRLAHTVAASAYPANANQIFPCENPVGASTCAEKFTGVLDFAERGHCPYRN